MSKIKRLDALKDHQVLDQISADDLRDLLLGYLEQEVGIRDTSYEIEKTAYFDDGPMTYYPFGYDRNVVNILLTPSTQRNPQQKLFQISHEVVHLLDPAKGRASNLEEGFASWFSVYICEYLVPIYSAKKQILRDECLYKEQFKLMDKFTDPFEIIKGIRNKGCTMCNVPKEILNKCAKQKYDEKEIEFLLQRFN